ncbi:MAG: efflux RND transporter periplasmic adaptor subunit [Lysobacter sp.]
MRSRIPSGHRAALLASLATATLAGLLSACGPGEVTSQEQRPVLVVLPGEAGGGVVSLTGDIRAREEGPLAFRVGGKLLARQVDIGDRVKRGDLLATLDPGDQQAQARAARARLSAAEAELGRARADQARFAALAKDQLISRSALDAHNASAAAAQGQVTAARAELDVALNQTAYSRLQAPADGVITNRQAEAGQVVTAGQAIYTLAVDGAREVAFAVSESHRAAIQPGQTVRVELWSDPGRQWPATVREVAPAADPASRTYAARATLDAPVGALQLGQSARVFIDAERSGQAVLSVPLTALQRDGDAVAVFVVDPKTSILTLQPVSVGAYGDDQVPVTSGLAADAWVVAAGGHLLRVGQKVTAVDRDNRIMSTDNAPAHSASD